MKNIITRLAPSPTSNFCHLGNIRTLLYNYLLAKKHGGKFLVRLEDTDRDRYTPGFLNYFRDTLDWLGIVPDSSYWNPDTSIGSFTQSERDYSDKINYLIDNGYAYYAFDTKDDLDKAHKNIPNFKYDATTRISMRNSFTMSKEDFDKTINDRTPYVIRFAVTPGVDITFTDAILGDITINTNVVDDKVLLKSNGIGSYHLCNVSDDHDMGVTHVLRGQEWVNSTPLHVLLYQAFGWDVPTFAHLPLIMNPDGKGKLSKRTSTRYGIPIAPLGYNDGDGNYVKGWKDLGYDPINHLIIDSDTNSSFVYAYGYNGQVVEINPTCSDLMYSYLEDWRDNSGNVADYDYWKEYLVDNFGYSSQLEDISSQINNDFVSLYYQKIDPDYYYSNTFYVEQCTSSTQNYGKNTVLFEIEIPEEQSIRLLSLDESVVLNLHCEDGYSTYLPYTELLDYIGGQSDCTLVGTSNVAWSLVVNHTLNDSWGGGDRYYDFGGSYISYSPGANTYSAVYYESYPVIIDVNSQ